MDIYDVRISSVKRSCNRTNAHARHVLGASGQRRGRLTASAARIERPTSASAGNVSAAPVPVPAHQLFMVGRLEPDSIRVAF